MSFKLAKNVDIIKYEIKLPTHIFQQISQIITKNAVELWGRLKAFIENCKGHCYI